MEKHCKQKFKLKDACKKGNHEWRVSKWLTRGTQQKATEFYCIYCLITCDEMEKEIQARNALSEQPDVTPAN